MAAPTSRQLGQPVLVENLGGVSGALGAQKVLSARADGYYLFQGSPNELILAPLRLAGCMLALGATLMSQGASAADYPSRPVMMMVLTPAASDAIAASAAPTSRQLGQPVLVENLGGVSGALGAQKVLSARADGYYLFQGSPNELILAPSPTPASSSRARTSNWCR